MEEEQRRKERERAERRERSRRAQAWKKKTRSPEERAQERRERMKKKKAEALVESIEKGSVQPRYLDHGYQRTAGNYLPSYQYQGESRALSNQGVGGLYLRSPNLNMCGHLVLTCTLCRALGFV